MRKFRHFISSILISILILSSSFSVFADSTNTYNQKNINLSANHIELMKKEFENMSDKEKSIFFNTISNNKDLIEFHKTYIDPNFSSKKYARRKRSFAGHGIVGQEALATFEMTLENLNLPWAIQYSAVSCGGGLAAALADGPLPFGDALAVVSGIGFGVACAWYWDDIQYKMDDILDAFGTLAEDIRIEAGDSFESACETANNVRDAISDLFSDAQTQSQTLEENYNNAKEEGLETENHSICTDDKLPSKGCEPYSSQDFFGKTGLSKRRYFDKNGNADLDIHYDDHGNPAKHPKVPHRHDWEDGSMGEGY